MEWISVRDKLPGYNKVVLWVHKGCVHAGHLGLSDTGLKFFHAEDCFDPDHISEVDWWMPYPNPPKSEQGDSKNSSQAVQQANYEICPKCGGSGRIYMCADDGEGIKCHRCNGAGELS